MPQVFRPSVVMSIKLRFDEAITGEEMPTPESIETLLQKPVTDDSGKPSPLPGILQPGSDQFSFLSKRVPKTLSWEKPGYRQAAHFKATFDYRELPIDPILVRAAAVEIHAGTVSHEDFAKGLSGRGPNGALVSILNPPEASNTSAGGRKPLVCIVDEWSVEHDEKRSEVTMEGRDLRGVLIDTPINAGIPDKVQGENNTTPTLIDELDLTKPVNEVVEQILRYNIFFTEMTVVVNADDWPGGVVPAPGHQDNIPRNRKGARGKKTVSTQDTSAADGGLSFWDLIVKVCYLVGGIPYFSGTELHIRPSMTVYDKLRGPIDPVRNPTPFKDGKTRDFDPINGVALDSPLKIRRLMYGRDTERLKSGRKYQGWRKPKVIRAVGFDPDAPAGTQRTIIGIWPPEETLQKTKKAVTSASSGKSVAGQEILSIPVPGVRSISQLTQIAHSIYEEIGRGEMTGECETSNLSSFGGDNADPDLLWLEPGDGIEIYVDIRSISQGAPAVSTLMDHYRDSTEDLIEQDCKDHW